VTIVVKAKSDNTENDKNETPLEKVNIRGWDRLSQTLNDYGEMLERIPVDGGSFAVATRDEALFMSGEADDLFAGMLDVVPDPSASDIGLSVNQLAQNLQAIGNIQHPVNETDIEKAADLLIDIIQSPSPAEVVAERLKEVDQLLPALIELNIRQAQFEGRKDLAQGLAALKENIDLQLSHAEDLMEDSGSDALSIQSAHPVELPKFSGKVLLLLPDVQRPSARMLLARDSLAALGCEVTVASRFDDFQPGRFDVALISNPHIRPAVLTEMAACTAIKIPIIVDIDANYENLPLDHLEYDLKGLGSLESAKAYTASLLLAQSITVPNSFMAVHFRQGGYSVQIVPDGWSNENILWKKRPPRRDTINLGWLSTSGQLEDLLPIRRIIIRTMREFQNTQLIITGNYQIDQLFKNLPDNRRILIPEMSLEDYPYLLGQMDILMVPMRNIPYNLGVSDQILVEAGVKGIPWVASPMPAFTEWKIGGILADTPEEWHTSLRSLVMDAELRMELGQVGEVYAHERESNDIGPMWFDVLHQAFDSQFT
jgi:glycosyltransferase involved in cell wall biosynthesis